MFKNSKILLISLLFLSIFQIIYTVKLGFISIDFHTLFNIFSGIKVEDKYRFIILDIRLPRVLVAFLVGAGLSIAGVIFQSVLLNPLADPYTLGISSGAAFGAAFAFILAIFGISTQISIPIFAFLGAVLALLFVIFFVGKNLSSVNLIIAGIIVSAILSAGIGFLKYIAGENVSELIFWLMGSFVSKTWIQVVIITFAVLISLIISLLYANELNIISMGDKNAYSLGINVYFVRLIMLITGSFISGISVSVSGIIPFIGLIVPHILRFLIGPDNKKLIVFSFFTGGILLLLADTITRVVLPHEVPVGVITSLIGGPFFLYILNTGEVYLNGNF
jgi:iron complex transport system permease protein